MKRVILLGDGMADQPHEAFGGKTVLQAAHTPNMDALARGGQLGLVHTTTDGLPPGSDVTNLSILGFDPKRYYTGRAPLEAASLGVRLGPADIAFRCNTVTTREENGTSVMDDYSAGHISSESARPLIEALDERLKSEGVRFYPGKSYRHLCVLRNVDPAMVTAAPHDIMGRAIAAHLPRGEGAERILRLMDASRELFESLEANRRLSTPVTQIWLWGQGRAPSLPTFKDRFGLNGAVVSAVDLLQGIGTYLGMKTPRVPGATGYLDTNYAGKVDTAMRFLEEGGDFVFLHVEAPDECGHNGIPEDKKRAIEDFDAKVVGPVLERLRKMDAFRVLLLPDHPTPLALRTHTRDAVPFVLLDAGDHGESSRSYCETDAAATGIAVPTGMALLDRLLA
ncbi:MAG: cofactor-independent phosphoglycerate mutase [Deltaproteobacteria bacterium]|nr:cofactor-independent phosphoglycerate mutase [Deltaproteobacteria bacterium]